MINSTKKLQTLVSSFGFTRFEADEYGRESALVANFESEAEARRFCRESEIVRKLEAHGFDVWVHMPNPGISSRTSVWVEV